MRMKKKKKEDDGDQKKKKKKKKEKNMTQKKKKKNKNSKEDGVSSIFRCTRIEIVEIKVAKNQYFVRIFAISF